MTEIQEGRYVLSPSKPQMVSALGAIRKDNGKVRLIHDCSRPEGSSVNDFSPLLLKHRFQSVGDAAHLVTPGGYMAKVDLHSAYRSVSIHPSNFPATGLQWTFKGHKDPTFMYDTRLPFGSKRAPGIFHRLTQAVRRMMERRGYSAIIAYLDDFLIIAPSYEECAEALGVLLRLLRSLGFAVAWSKVEGPRTALVFLGILINSVSMTLELPHSKLISFKSLLISFASRKRATCRQLQQLAGKLNWASQVVKGGRIFLRRILDIIAPLKHKSHKAILTADFHQDIAWWLSFLGTFNGVSCLPHEAPSFHVLTDASSIGAGYSCGHDWAYTNWQADIPPMTHRHINEKEVAAIVLAALRWAGCWRGGRVLVHTDNIVAKHAINTGTSRSPCIMQWTRLLFWLCASFDITIEAIHVPGHFHHLPDAISRLHEPGQSLRLHALLQEQCPALHCPHSHLPAHMSFNSFLYLFQSVVPSPSLRKH